MSLLRDLKAEHPDFWDWFKFAAFTGFLAWAVTSVLAAYIRGFSFVDWGVTWLGLVRLFRINHRRLNHLALLAH